MASQKEKAEAFRALHHGDKILILPNAWDVPSAHIFENAGFPAVATSSAGMLVSLGYPDGEDIPKEEFLAAIRRIARVLTIPLSVDIVGGFGETTEKAVEFVHEVIDAGGIGINIEDFADETKELVLLDKQVAKLKAIRRQADSDGIPLVINARTDALWYGEGDNEAKLSEAIRRAVAYKDNGADCVYPMGLADASSISRFVKELNFPVNVMIRKGLPTIKELEKLGVKRLSFGPSASYAAMGFLKRVSKEVLMYGDYNGLIDGAISFDELNNLAVRKKLN
jgi:2-methylisocitrate lyase-like PEP mutase family enzyme